MSDQSEFEQGQILACNAILGFLQRTGRAAIGADILLHWENGTLETVGAAAPVEQEEPTETFPLKMDHRMARQQGFTGNMCTNCSSLRMKVSGHCEVCEECGTTTGCS